MISWAWRCPAAIVLYMIGGGMLSAFCLAFSLSKLKLVMIKTFLWCINGKPLNILSSPDAGLFHTFLSKHTDPMCPAIIQIVMTVDGKPDIRRFTTIFQNRVIAAKRFGEDGHLLKIFPKLTQKVVRRFGFYAWEEDEEFSIDARVQLSKEVYSNEQSLMTLLQKIYRRPIPEDGPLWECVLLPKRFKDVSGSNIYNEYSILLRVHHCLYDGNSVVDICSQLFDKPAADNSGVSDFPVRQLAPVVRRSAFLCYLLHPKNRLTVSGTLAIIFNAIGIAFKAPWHMVMDINTTPDYHALHHGSAAHMDGRRLFAASPNIPIKLLKNTARTRNCTINDVFMFCAAAALQRHDAVSRYPTSNQLRVLMAIYLMPPGHLSQNGVSSAIFTIPLSNDRSPDWLRTISKTCAEQKSSSSLVTHYLISLMLGNHVHRAFLNRMTSGDLCTLTTTNLKGPESAHAILGGSVKDLFLLPNLLSTAAVSFSLLSYNGHVRVGVAVDRSVAANELVAFQLVKDFKEELEDIYAMINVLA